MERGPRDVLRYEPICLAVVTQLTELGLSGGVIASLLLASEEVTTAICAHPATTSAPISLARVLRGWRDLRLYEEAHRSKTYASAVRQSYTDFTNRDPRHAGQHDVYVAHRINHECLVVLESWLGIDPFLRHVETSVSNLSYVIEPSGCPVGDRPLMALIHRAFGEQKQLPTQALLQSLWRIVVDEVLGQELPVGVDRGQSLTDHLTQRFDERVQSLVVAPAPSPWPLDGGDRIRKALRSRLWESVDAQEVAYVCKYAEFRRAYDVARTAYDEAKRTNHQPAIQQTKEVWRVSDANLSAIMFVVLRDPEVREESLNRICAWLRKSAPSLAELLRA